MNQAMTLSNLLTQCHELARVPPFVLGWRVPSLHSGAPPLKIYPRFCTVGLSLHHRGAQVV
jgi:hypothetical protein